MMPSQTRFHRRFIFCKIVSCETFIVNNNVVNEIFCIIVSCETFVVNEILSMKKIYPPPLKWKTPQGLALPRHRPHGVFYRLCAESGNIL